MIKVFSPEVFNDYDNENLYGFIYAQNDNKWTIVHEQLNKAVTEQYKSIRNNSWPNTEAFLNTMAEQNIILKGSSTSEVLNYSQFLSALGSWYDIPDPTTDGERGTLINNFLDIRAFEQYVIENNELFEDNFIVNTWCQYLSNHMQDIGDLHDPIIDGWEGNVRIIDLDKFKAELKKKLKSKTEIDLNTVMEATENGIHLVDDNILLYYIFKVCEIGQPFQSIGGVYIFIDANGNIQDVDGYVDVVSKNQIPGYEFFGFGKRNQVNYYLKFGEFEYAINHLLPEDKTVSVSPRDFLNEQISKNIVTYIPPSFGVNAAYRIENIDIFRTNYSMYRIGINVSNLSTNGDMVLLPSVCDAEAEINGAWDVTLTHPIDRDGRSSFIQKGCVLALPLKIAREQTYENQLFRVYDVQNNFDSVEVTAYPVAQESAFECPVDLLYFENVTAQQFASALSNKYPEKYLVQTDISNGKANIYAQNSNLQEIIAGSDEATFLNTYGGEIVYDNYIYRIMKQSGRKLEDSKDYLISYKANMKGIKVIENTFDVTTRIYPTSSEGYNFDSVMAAYQQYSDEFGPLTQKKPTRHWFEFNEMCAQLDYFDQHSHPDGLQASWNEVTPIYQSDGSAGDYISNAIKMELSNQFSEYIIDIPLQCTRFCTNLLVAGVIKGTGPNEEHIDQESIKKLNGSWEALNYIGYTFDIIEDRLEYQGEGNVVDNILPGPFIEELRKLRNDFLADNFVTTDYTIEPVYPETIPRYVDAPNIRDYPFVHARSIPYDNITLVNRYDESENREKTPSEITIENAMASITGVVESLSKKYIKLAHQGKWDHKKRIKTKSKTYDYSSGNASKTHLHTNKYNPRTDRIRLPYGYILYSFKDAIEYLKHEAVNTWCTDEAEAEIFCEAIENGFKWCEKTNIAKWMWHTTGANKFYGTKNKSDYIQNAYHNLDNKMYWFNGKGYIRKGNNTSDSSFLSDYSEYKWVDNPVEVTEGEGDDAKTVTKHRYRFQDEKGNYMRNCWIEESASKHYYADSDGYRKSWKVETGEDKDGNKTYKEIDYDDEEWTFIPGSDGSTFRLTGWRYGNHKKGNYPTNGQFMYIKEYKGWFRFVKSDAGEGTIQGNYLSDATWSWKKYKKGWRYTDGNHSYITWQWAKIDSKWYFFAPKGGYVDTTTDDFDDNAKSFNTENKHPDIDYNREGVTSVGTQTESYSTQDADTFDADRDGVQAWIQKDFIKEVKREVLKQHMAIWDGLRSNLWNAACYDITTLRNESLSVEIDFEQLSKYEGYEDLEFLKDLYLGDYVHVSSSLHNFEGDLRVVSIKYDCLTNIPKEMTLGYPVNTFIQRNAKLNPSGTVKFYSAVDYIEDGFGDFIEDGTIKNPYIPIK